VCQGRLSFDPGPSHLAGSLQLKHLHTDIVIPFCMTTKCRGFSVLDMPMIAYRKWNARPQGKPS